jgi:hypothetical protein
VKKLAVRDFEYFLDRPERLDKDVDKLIGKSLNSMTGQRWKGKTLN